MILAPGVPGAAFGSLSDGDGRVDRSSRVAISDELGISPDWATVTQVHGDTIVSVVDAGHHGEADGLATATPGLPLVVATADCVPVVVMGHRNVAIVHAGWRGVANGIVPEAVSIIQRSDDSVSAVVIGPHIGACCYEVGGDVIEAIGGNAATTTWGTVSADLEAAIRSQVPGASVVSTGPCTMGEFHYASHRRDGTSERQVAIAWIP